MRRDSIKSWKCTFIYIANCLIQIWTFFMWFSGGEFKWCIFNDAVLIQAYFICQFTKEKFNAWNYIFSQISIIHFLSFLFISFSMTKSEWINQSNFCFDTISNEPIERAMRQRWNYQIAISVAVFWQTNYSEKCERRLKCESKSISMGFSTDSSSYIPSIQTATTTTTNCVTIYQFFETSFRKFILV